MTEYFDIAFQSRFSDENDGAWKGRGNDYSRLTKEQAVEKLYGTFERVYESRKGINNDGDRFWKIVTFDGELLHIKRGGSDSETEHIWRIVPSRTLVPGFWVHGEPTDNIDRVVNYLNGDEHDRSKVEFVKSGKRYQVTIEEV